MSERLTEFAATDFEKSKAEHFENGEPSVHPISGEAPKSGNKVKKKSPKHGRKVERV